MSATRIGAVQNCLRKALSALRSRHLMTHLPVLATLFVSASVASAQLAPGGPIDFGSSPVGTAVTETVTFQATTLTTVGAISILTNGASNLDYTVKSTTCSGTIIPPNGCSVTILFTPTQIGERNGALLVSDTTHNVVNKTFLHGIGTGSSFAMAPTSVTSLSTATGLTPATFLASSSVYDGSGNLYFTDIQNGRILERSSLGVYSSIATLSVTASSSIVIAGDGTLYVSAQGSVYSLAPGSTPTAISTPGVTLVTPTGLAIDGYGALFIADSANGNIARYSLTGSGTNLVTITGVTALTDPTGLAVDNAQNLYIADSGNNRIVKVNPDSPVPTPASVITIPNFTFNDPQGIVIDPAGTIYLADTANARIVEYTAQYTTPVSFALTDRQLTLTTPTGINLNTSGDLVISDNALGLVFVPRSTPSITFPTPTMVGTLDATDDPISLTVQSTGNISAELFIPTTGSNPSISTSAFLFGSGGTCPTVSAGSTTVNLFAVGQICTYPIDFEPTQLGVNTANLIFETGPQGATTPSYTQTVPLTGNGISGATGFKLVASPSINTVGGTDSLVLTAVLSNGSTATYYVGTITFTTTDSTGVFKGGTTYQLTAADDGVLTIPAATGIQFNQTGTFTVSATDGTFNVTSNTVQIVNASTMTLTSSVNPSDVNQSTNFVATITNAGPAATGTVSFYSNGLLIGTGTLVNGVATLPYGFATCGDYAITVTYPGDSTTQPASAGPLTQDVLCNISPASSTLTSSQNPTTINTPVTFTATLVSTGSATPTGTVSFYSNGVLIGAPVTLVNGVASIPDTFTVAGTYPITAVYSGDGNNAAATLGPLQEVVHNTSSMSLNSTINPSNIAQSTNLVATITTSGTTATGSVSFFSNGVLIGTATLNGGTATLPHAFATCGAFPITATYAGDSNTAAASAGPITQTVLCSVTTSSTLTSSQNPTTINTPVTFTATVVSTGGTTPTGTVSFYSNGVLIGAPVTLVNGVASIPDTFTVAGTYPITAVYSGDANNAAATLGPLQEVVHNTSSMSLNSTINPSKIAQSTNLVATITTSGTTATGSVSFFSNGVLIGTATLNGGTATLPYAFATCGAFPITATYAGDSNTAAASAGPLTQTVLCSVTTSSTLTSSLNPSNINQSVTFTATIVSSSATTPTGTVSFFSNGVLIGAPVTLVNGVATIPDTFTVAGTYPITAVYSGDANNAAATLGPLQQVVHNTSSMSLNSTINPSNINQSTNFVATITTSGTAATGTVTFFSNGVAIGTATLNAGTATLPYSFATCGAYPITATYAGDGNTAASSAGPLTQTVLCSVTTSSTLVSSKNPTTVNTPVTFTATIVSSSATPPSGTVTFYSNGVAICTAVFLSGGVAQCGHSFPTAGTYPITAVYSGDANNAGATLGPLQQVVDNTANMTLASSVNPSLPAQSTTFTATITTSGVAATGTVTFTSNGTTIGTGTLAGGVASLPFTFATCGVYTIVANYPGDANTAAATATLTQTVLCPISPASSSLTSSINPSSVNQSTTFKATLVSNGGPVPTGTVTFYSNGVQIGLPVTLVNGVATIPDSFAAAGTYPITAVYSGDGFNSGYTLGPLQQVVVNATTMTLNSATNPVLITTGTTILTATIPTVGANAPTGTVTFKDNTTGLTLAANVTVTAGVAHFTASFTLLGDHNLVAVYSGDGNYAAATSNIVIQDVVDPTTAVLTSNTNPSLVGQSVTLTSTITSAAPTITGTVSFYDGGVLIGTSNVGGTSATLPYVFTSAGTHTLTCVYSGDVDNATSSCNPLSQVVVNATTMTLTSATNPVLITTGTTILTATIPTVGANAPTGTVTFKDNTTGLTLASNVTVTAGVAHFTASFTVLGDHNLVAVYSGDANYAATTSNIYVQDVVDPTSTVLSTNINPSLVGQLVTLTATITSAAPTITGTVTFYDGGMVIGTSTVGGTSATLGYTFTTPGTHTLTCVYSGDVDNATSSCNPISQVVQSTPTMTLTSSKNPSAVNQTVTFTATVSASGHTPGGTITFTSNGVAICTAVPMTGGVATCSYTFTAAGHYPIVATYSGDGSTAPATANLIQIVGTTLTVTLTGSPNPATYTNPVTFTATLSGYTAPPPTGTVTFTIDGVAQTPSAVAAPTAIFTTSTLSVGSHTITCVYNGDTNYLPAPCLPTVTENIVNPTTSVLTVNPNPVILGNVSTLTATVTSAGGNIPTGLVTFTDGGATIGTGTLNGTGIATLPYTFTTTGAHSLSCTYAGDANDAPSTCNVIAFDVQQPTTASLQDSPNPSVVNQSVLFTTTLASANTAQAFTGTITISTGATTLCVATLPAVTCSYSFPIAGTYPVIATYSGDTYHAPATSNTVNQVVLNVATIVLTSAVNPILVNNPDVLTVVATSTGPTPTGTITFYDGNAPIGIATLAAGTASLNVTFAGSGTHALTALYSGDPVTAPATSNLVSQVVADYAVAVASGTPSSATILAGGTASFSLMLTPLVTSTLPDAVTFTIDGMPAGMKAVFLPTTLAAGSGVSTFALSVTAPQITGHLQGAPAKPNHRNVAPAVFALMLLPLALIRKRKKLGAKIGSALLLLVMAAGFTGLTGCITDSSSGYYGQVTQTYSLVVSANSGNLSRTTTVTVTVQ